MYLDNLKLQLKDIESKIFQLSELRIAAMNQIVAVETQKLEDKEIENKKDDINAKDDN